MGSTRSKTWALLCALLRKLCLLCHDMLCHAVACHAVLCCVQVIDVWEPVTESDVQTPLEVYAELQEDGYDVVGVDSCVLGALRQLGSG